MRPQRPFGFLFSGGSSIGVPRPVGWAGVRDSDTDLRLADLVGLIDRDRLEFMRTADKFPFVDSWICGSLE